MFTRTVSLTGILVFIVVVASSQAAFADGSPGKTLVGTWEVYIDSNEPPAGEGEPPGDPDGVPDAFDITVVHRDGTVSNSDPALGTGHGIWRRLGASQFELKFKTLVPFINAFQQLPGTTLTVTTKDLTVHADGMTATGTFFVDVEPNFIPDDPVFGGQVPDFGGNITFVRMIFDD